MLINKANIQTIKQMLRVIYIIVANRITSVSIIMFQVKTFFIKISDKFDFTGKILGLEYD